MDIKSTGKKEYKNDIHCILEGYNLNDKKYGKINDKIWKDFLKFFICFCLKNA